MISPLHDFNVSYILIATKLFHTKYKFDKMPHCLSDVTLGRVCVLIDDHGILKNMAFISLWRPIHVFDVTNIIVHGNGIFTEYSRFCQ